LFISTLYSVTKSEEPERDFVAITYLDVIRNNITIGQVGYLQESFLLSSYFKQIFIINLQVVLLGILNAVAVGNHGGEEGLAGSSRICS